MKLNNSRNYQFTPNYQFISYEKKSNDIMVKNFKQSMQRSKTKRLTKLGDQWFLIASEYI